MRKNLFSAILFSIIFLLCIGIGNANAVPLGFWGHYGYDIGSSYNYNKLTGTSYDINFTKSYLVGYSPYTNPTIQSFNFRSYNQTAVVWGTGGDVTLINLIQHQVTNTYSTGLSPTGQVDRLDLDNYYGVFVNDSISVVFAQLEINENSWRVVNSIKLDTYANRTVWEGIGVKCYNSITGDVEQYCVFRNHYRIDTPNLEFYQVNVSDSGNGWVVYKDNYTDNNGVDSNLNYNSVPAIEQNTERAYFTRKGGISGSSMYICAFDLLNHQKFNGGLFTDVVNGCEKLGDERQLNNPEITNPHLINLGGVEVIAVGTRMGYSGTGSHFASCLNILSLGGANYPYSPNCSSGHTNAGDVGNPTEPFYAKCKFQGITSEGIGFWKNNIFGGSGISDNNKFIFFDDFGVFYEYDTMTSNNEIYQPYQNTVSADLDGDGTTELITAIEGSDGKINMTIFSCNNGSGGLEIIPLKTLTINEGIYAPILSDFNYNGQIDVLLQHAGLTKEFGNLGTTSIPICPNGICELGEDHTSCSIDCPYVTCGNHICEAGIGENHATCPIDCPSPYCGNGICDGNETNTNCQTDCPYTPIQTVGGASPNMNIPPQLVNPEHPSQGLLPELYYGIIGFFQPIMIPLMYILVMVMLILLFVGIATAIGKLTKS